MLRMVVDGTVLLASRLIWSMKEVDVKAPAAYEVTVWYGKVTFPRTCLARGKRDRQTRATLYSCDPVTRQLQRWYSVFRIPYSVCRIPYSVPVYWSGLTFVSQTACCLMSDV